MEQELNEDPLTDTGKWVKRLLLEKMEQRRLLEELLKVEQERNEREKTREAGRLSLMEAAKRSVMQFLGLIGWTK